MKCPNCGKKMKKDSCKKCGYDANAKAVNSAMNVNYFMYDPANPDVVYPMSISGQAQPNPAAVTKAAAPVSKKEAKKALKGMSKKERKAAKKAAKKAEAANVAGRKNTLSRLFGLVLAVLSVVALAVLSYHIVINLAYNPEDLKHEPNPNFYPSFATGSLLAAISGMLESGSTILGVLPAFPITGRTGLFYNASIYAFAIGCVLAILNAVGAVFSKKKAPKRVRRALFFLGLGALAYVVCMGVLLNRDFLVVTDAILSEVNLMQVAGYYVDTNALLIAVAGLGLSLLFKIFRRRK